MKKHIVTYSTENAAYVEGRKMRNAVLVIIAIVTILAIIF